MTREAITAGGEGDSDPGFLMTLAEVREWHRLRRIRATIISSATAGHDGLSASFRAAGATMRLDGHPRPTAWPAEMSGWDAADALIGPARTPPDVSPVGWCEVGRSHLIGEGS